MMPEATANIEAPTAGYMPEAQTSDRRTPKSLYAVLNARYAFTLDAAATQRNALAPHYLNRRINALHPVTRWPGRVFVNPPYGHELYRWVDKALEEMQRGTELIVMLLPAKTDTRWFAKLAKWGEVELLTSRLRFDGMRTKAPFGSMLAYLQSPLQMSMTPQIRLTPATEYQPSLRANGHRPARA